MKYKQYPKYEDSGVDWIGYIPEGWKVKKLKFVSSLFGRIGYRGYTVDDIVAQGEGAITLSPSNIIDDKFSLKKKTYLSLMKYEESPEIHVFENDILLCKTSSVGKNCIVPKHSEKMTINPQLVVLKPFNISSKFLSFFMNCSKYKDQINSSVEGSTMKTISQQKLLNHYILFPPSDQQNQISEFLHKQTTQFDELIAKFKAQIILLEEKRQATINQALTKGLDPSVPMKDSGVEWIGEIPEEWKVCKLKQIGNLKAGGTPSRSNSLYWDDGIIPWMSSGEVNYNAITSSREKITKLGLEKSSATIFPIGTVLVAITGEGKTRGQSAILEIEAATNQSVIGIVHDKKIIHNSFLFLYFQNQYLSLRNYSHGSVQSGLNLEILKNYPIIFPATIKEQNQISEFLHKQTTQFDELIAKFKAQIILLEEKRQALITAAVTGKIDVRGEITV
jgi:type I restriction enzyme, S subunit